MSIVEKSRGKNKYYYLDVAVRKGDKIIHKQKYLGKEIPKNIEELEIDFEREANEDFWNRINKIRDNFQREWKGIPESAKKRELEEISIAFTYNTNAIEGSTITLEEVREIVQDRISPNKPIRDVREAEAHSKVFLGILQKKEKITEKLFLDWHRIIFGESKQDIAGKFRDYLVRVGPYLAPDWQDVEEMISELVKFIHNSNLNPVELSARAHYKFEKIHPFGDGNGRIGRLLMNDILWKAGYPMLIIEYKKRRSYYKALQKDEEGFVKYFIRRYMTVHKKRYLS